MRAYIIILSYARMCKEMKNTQGITFACFTLIWIILRLLYGALISRLYL